MIGKKTVYKGSKYRIEEESTRIIGVIIIGVASNYHIAHHSQGKDTTNICI